MSGASTPTEVRSSVELVNPNNTPADEFKSASVSSAESLARLKAEEDDELRATPKPVVITNVPLPTPPRAGPVRERHVPRWAPIGQTQLQMDPDDDTPQPKFTPQPTAQPVKPTPDTVMEERLKALKNHFYDQGLGDGLVTGVAVASIFTVGLLGWLWWSGRLNFGSVGSGLKLTAGPVQSLRAQQQSQ